MKAFWQLVLINYKEFFREPGIVFWSLLFPVLMAWVLGIAFTNRGEMQQSVAWVSDHDTISTEIDSLILTGNLLPSKNSGKSSSCQIELENQLGRYTYRFVPVSWDSAILMLKRGETSLIVAEDSGRVKYLLDPMNAEARFNYILISAAAKGAEIGDYQSVQILSQKGTRYIDFLIPGLLAMGIMNGFLWGIGYNLIEIRTKKLLRRMVATPMKKIHFLLGQFFARISLSVFEAGALIFFAWLYFRIEIIGSYWAFAGMFFSGSFCFAGMAVLMASRTSSSRVGNGLINLISLPMTILSGVFFSYHNFPDVVIPVIKFMPLTMLADSMRSIMIEGTGFIQNLPEFLVLTAVGLICLIAGIRIYKWY